MIRAKLVVTKQGAPLWMDYLASPVLVMTSNISFSAVGCEDGSLHIYSPAGRRLLPAIVLESTPVLLQSLHQWLVCMTSTGLLYSWDIYNLTCCIEGVSVAPVLQQVVELEKEAACIKDIRIQEDGLPIIITAAHQAFVYHTNMKTWLRAHDSCVKEPLLNRYLRLSKEKNRKATQENFERVASSDLSQNPSDCPPSYFTHTQLTEPSVHVLRYGWVFWFMHRSPGEKITDYEGAMKKIATFKTVEEFWAVYSHLRRPSDLPNISDYHLFKQGVRPVWEDDVNINGGKWIVRVKKGLASRYWESLVLAIIGDQFDVDDEICGAVLSIRGSEDIISVWNKTSSNGKINLKIRDTIKRHLNLPAETTMEYKTHNDALRDKSSFRNTDVFR
ncbi:hypothetical protein G6F29_007619 [Rhizopus arrhizus]|uniref:Protein HIRA-like C-terminal domain-containing protein n=1 Tax=Rhizopus oryzae TaxID=64495 RepID=A0A9P6X8V6_RHIOR|nr:hypothetical protein G6F22_000989 [Rhizopus arrhizus]KAG1423325.1 hypothetical protein G6F58_002859 [Rhizopus delemar]KAG0811339.1 hypothetical protein G6F20_007229 [Rhizopus arrhizus]KAG0830026.1 hypothetical protein G6F19_007429 [Rhizopus arrhizus]KAG0831808.1 hypothetical protein G6F18_007496 [Rhizopus arrhizus]